MIVPVHEILPTPPPKEDSKGETDISYGPNLPATLGLAPSPFDRPTDLVLQSSDGVRFHVFRWILMDASPVFADMFNIPQPPALHDRPVESGAQTRGMVELELTSQLDNVETSPSMIDVSEDSTTLEALLRIIYPLPTIPEPSSFEAFARLAQAAEKYQMAFTTAALAPLLHHFSRLHPLRVYAWAERYNIPEAARRAAQDFLRMEDMFTYVDELAEISCKDYHRLLQYRSRCSQAMKAIGTTDIVRAWPSQQENTPEQGDPFSTGWTWFDCKRCFRKAQSAGKRSAFCAPWFRQHWDRLIAALVTTPYADAARAPILMELVARDAVKCRACRPLAFVQLQRFTELFVADVERRLSQIQIETR
ncbi:hypothetical protein GY45DRAFT_442243 [Cubamyces sp. BRFM 1775]|nr:hypothetical protein GY45DRAFT_442243 [Cubamyces sp. BRFM 1775]